MVRPSGVTKPAGRAEQDGGAGSLARFLQAAMEMSPCDRALDFW